MLGLFQSWVEILKKKKGKGEDNGDWDDGRG